MATEKYILTDIIIYPVKSLGGIEVQESEVTDRGLKFDRRFMLVDSKGNFMSQRTNPEMALLQTTIENNKIIVFHKKHNKLRLELNLQVLSESRNPMFQTFMWDDVINVCEFDKYASSWFTDILKTNCKLVYMPDTSNRLVDQQYASGREITSLSDGYPFLIIGKESLNLLNSKLAVPMPMNRFRPNFVFSGGKPHDEDNWNAFKIEDVTFRAVKPCARCIVTTTDQETGARAQEPLKTLATYRSSANKVLFGQNLIHSGSGIIKTGSEITLIN